MGELFYRCKEIVRQNRQIVSYLFFGACTTVVNIICYAFLYRRLGVENVASTALAWLTAVLFAYAVNRRFVFRSRRQRHAFSPTELLRFFGCRALTGLLDVGIMYFAVDCMMWSDVAWKLFSNITVITLNYLASKLWIFKDSE